MLFKELQIFQPEYKTGKTLMGTQDWQAEQWKNIMENMY